MLKFILSFLPARAVAGLGIVLTTVSASAATITWSGASGAGTNWSTGGNWVGGTSPTGSDDVKFTEQGTNSVPGTPNSLVDVSFAGYIGSLQFGQSNGTHTVLIDVGQTLNITNTGGLFAGTSIDVGAARVLTNSIKGAGATLNISNAAANLVLNQGQGTANGSRAVLDLSGLDKFTANIFAIGIGSIHFQNATNQRNSGILFLARTNNIRLNLTNTLANYSTTGTPTNAIELVHAGGGNNASVLSFIYLGQSNAFYVDSLGIGRSKSSASSAATMTFNPAFASPSAFFRGVGGNSSRVTWWAIADMADNASSAQLAIGTNDFSLGTVDALVETMSLGRDCSPSHTAGGFNVGVLTFSAGTIDVNNLIMGNQVLGPATSVAGNLGIVNVNGATAKLVVNNTLELGHTTVAFVPGIGGSGTNAAKTYGILNIRNGGTVLANRIIVGAASTNNNSITLTNGTLVVSNGVGTLASRPTTFAMTNSLLRLNITGITNIFCTNLVSSGVTNVIGLDSVAVFASYPKQVVLIKYTTALGVGVTNFGLTNIPASAPGAYLSNNVANSSLDLVLPFDPRPIITSQPASYSGNPGDNVTFTVGISGNSATPLSYQWYRGATPVANGPTGNGSTNSGSTTASLSINNAQPGDNGNYTVIISNAYGTATNSPAAVLTISAGCVAPGLTGPNNTTVIQSNNATFSASASGNPVPDLQWRRNGVDISGQTGSSYTVTNAQYPADDGAVFSLVASNACGMVTNSATLTVIVPPVISVQPVSLVVTSTQSATFSVTASGVPTPTYQWQFNNIPISGETNATLTIASATSANIGTYKVVVNNAAGSVTSSNATLIVNSTMSATAFSPSNGATGICYDTPLAVTFSSAPSLGAAGTIKIYNVTNSATPVDTINVALGATQQRSFPGDGQSFTYQTIQISGSTAKIYPHFSVMSSNATYYVTIDNGAFTDASGAYFTGITATNVWKFSTKVGGPVDPTNPVVNADGSADFVTVQGAVNSLATGTNATQRVISIRNGLYNEIVDVAGKHNVTLRGQSRAGAVIAFPNNATFQTANGGTTHARMTFKVNANDIALDTLTVSNSTPQGGSQAEALMIESSAKRCIVYNTELDSRQDTILGNQNSSQTYFYQTIVKGNFDYVWGGGNFYFDQCEIRTIGGTANANFSAARTDTAASQSLNFPWLNPGGTYTGNGMSFVNCIFTAESGVGPVTLAGSNGTAANNVSWFGCDFATNYVAPSAALFTGNYLFWQSANTMTNAPVTFAVLTTIGVTNNDPRLLAATNIPTWFYGWTPSITPTIVTNPVSQTVTAGQPASFGVLAGGFPLTYQWQHAGTNLPGATASTLNLASATVDNAGSYAVIVTTPAGSVTSSPATLTVNPLGITVTPDGQSKVYGTMNPALTYSYAPALLMGDSFSGGLSRAMGESVGSYAITQGTLSLNANYTISFITGSNLVITPAALSITAGNTNKVLGATVTFAGTEFTTSALVIGDSVTSVSLASAGAGAGAAAGVYPIVPSAAVGSGLGNYTINSINGALTVTGSPDSTFTGMVANPDGSVTMTFSGSNGVTFRIQATADLTNPTWTDVSTNTVSGGTASFTDTNTSGLTKFYRVVFP